MSARQTGHGSGASVADCACVCRALAASVAADAARASARSKRCRSCAASSSKRAHSRFWREIAEAAARQTSGKGSHSDGVRGAAWLCLLAAKLSISKCSLAHVLARFISPSCALSLTPLALT
eukprot:4158967-Pleurochrysis_carterae.AAC.1